MSLHHQYGIKAARWEVYKIEIADSFYTLLEKIKQSSKLKMKCLEALTDNQQVLFPMSRFYELLNSAIRNTVRAEVSVGYSYENLLMIIHLFS